MRAAALRDSSVSLLAFSFFTVQATLKMSMMMTSNNNVALPILLSVRGFCFLVFLLFFSVSDFRRKI